MPGAIRAGGCNGSAVAETGRPQMQCGLKRVRVLHLMNLDTTFERFSFERITVIGKGRMMLVIAAAQSRPKDQFA